MQALLVSAIAKEAGTYGNHGQQPVGAGVQIPGTDLVAGSGSWRSPGV